MEVAAQKRRFEFDVFGSVHGRHVDDAAGGTRQPSVCLNGRKHMRRAAAMRDKHRPALGGSVGADGVLIEFSADRNLPVDALDFVEL
jgi:hypothetical protein